MTARPGLPLDLSGRTALVTGSTAGLGYAIADTLARAGANIVLHGLEADATTQAACDAMAAQYGIRTLLSGADLRDVDQIEGLMSQASDVFGSIDIVVNNAVIRHFAPAHELAREQWDDSLSVNLSAAFHLARLSIPAMREKCWGRIINLSSVYGTGATANRVGYITTKTALLGMTRALAVETATTGITCNAVSPGTVPTPAITTRIADIARDQGVGVEQAERDYLAARQPTGRFVAMENVAALIGFLCSDAGRDITGASLPIDGGWSAA